MSEPGRDASAAKKKCIACGNDIDRDATECPVCKFSHGFTFCEICKKAMPETAERCNSCGAFQGLKKNLLFAAMVVTFISGIFSLISGGFTGLSYLVDRNSDTKFKVTSIDAKVLHLKVWNTGRKPSRIVGYRLRFSDESRLDDAKLVQVDGDAVINPGNPVNVGVTVNEFVRHLRPGSKDEQYTKDEIREWLSDQKHPLILQVEADVEESGHLWNLSDHPFVVSKTDAVSAGLIREFILGRIPDVG